MKKALFLVGILLLSVVTTACINNKAQSYMESGNYKEAIERLKSSIDLDGAIFETHYNLAVAYTQVEDYANATDEFQKAIDQFFDMYGEQIYVGCEAYAESVNKNVDDLTDNEINELRQQNSGCFLVKKAFKEHSFECFDVILFYSATFIQILFGLVGH